MDKLSKFLTDTFGKTKTAEKVTVVSVPELDVFEKRAYGMALSQACQDESFLAQFEGTPLLPQAIALCEQELAQEQAQLQKRMQRAAQQQNESWEQDSIASDGIRLQKQQLMLELYKTKAMTPTPRPGDAEIGAPQMGAEVLDPAAAGGMAPGGAAGGAPVEAAAPKMAGIKDMLKNHRGAAEGVALAAGISGGAYAHKKIKEHSEKTSGLLEAMAKVLW